MSEFVTKVYSLDNFFAKQQKDGSVDVVGYGSVFCQKDLHEDVVERGAFTESLINFTRKNEFRGKNHNDCFPSIYKNEYHLHPHLP